MDVIPELQRNQILPLSKPVCIKDGGNSSVTVDGTVALAVGLGS